MMMTYSARILSATAFLSAALVLSACSTKTRTLTVGDPGAEDRAVMAERRAETEKARADAA